MTASRCMPIDEIVARRVERLAARPRVLAVASSDEVVVIERDVGAAAQRCTFSPTGCST